MSLQSEWCHYEEEWTSNQRLAAFLRIIPESMEQFFRHEDSNLTEFLPEINYPMSKENDFLKAFEEAKNAYVPPLNALLKFNPDDPFNEDFPFDFVTPPSGLEEIGFDTYGLKFKLNMVNLLWEKIYKYVLEQKMRFLNFMDQRLGSLTGIFLRLLKEVLESLKMFYKPLEVIIEIASLITAVIETIDTIRYNPR